MTPKRFNRVGGYVYDGDKCISHFEDVTHRDDIVKLLNELHEENEQLQHDATILIQSNQDYRKENEQLKQQLKELKEDVPLLLAFYRWYPFAVEKKEHQAYNRLWDFVND